MDSAVVRLLDPLASWDPAPVPAVVAAVVDCRSLGPAHIAPVAVVVCALGLAEAVFHMRLHHCTVAAAAHFHSRPAGRCSSHGPSRAARIRAARIRAARVRADHSRNRSTAGHTGCRSLHTAAVPAAQMPDRSVAVVVVAAAGDRRTAAGMPWRRGVRYRISASAKPHAPGASIVE